MAATTRVTTPVTLTTATSTPRTITATEPFPAFESAPRIPTSLAEAPNPPLSTFARDNNTLLRPQPLHNAAFTTVDLSPKTDHARYSPARSPAPLTGAAAMADVKRKKQQQQQQQDAAQASRHTSPNPPVEAMQSLIGGGGISRPSDAPAPDKLSEPLRKAAEKIQLPDGNASSLPASSHPSPTSLSSFGSMDHTAGHGMAMTATAGQPPNSSGPQYTAEPAQMLEPSSFAGENGSVRRTANAGAEEDGDEADTAEEAANKSFSYPGPPDQQQQLNRRDAGAARGMSFPGLGYNQTSPKSPASSNKRHKCPYCATDFTRHHNLKSHLLTHSQEKPYVCQTCQARFRRLHDLKRHTKLHTGERPHTCDKCGRRFARGDALARHNKGPGGCAGRRSSFGADDDLDGPGGDGMDGVEYTGGDGDGDDDDDEEDNTTADDPMGRRVSEPSRKRAHIETSNDPNRSVYRQHSSTYPPVQQHRIGDMGPPAVLHPATRTSTSPQDLTAQSNPAAAQQQQHPQQTGPLGSSYYAGFSQHGGVMTESPKPLSPGQPPDQHRLAVDQSSAPSLNRNRSPSLTTQFQQAHFGRGSGGRTPPQPPPAQPPFNQSAPQLPPLALASGSSQSRPGIQPHPPTGPGPSMLHHQQVPPPTAGGLSNSGSVSSHGQSSSSSLRELVGVAGSASADADLWSHFRSLESKFSRMQDEYELRISRLQEEVISLKGQLHSVAAGGGGGPPGSYPGDPRY